MQNRSTMKAMKVMRFNDSLDSPALIAGTAPVPQPGRGEILIRVQAAGVTPTELQWYPTTHTPDGGRRTGAIPGHEFSGVVEAAGADADQGQIGQEVFGMNDWFADGATAEYCTTASTSVALKPPPIESPRSGDRPHWCFDGVAGIVRSGEPETRRANSDPRRIRGGGCLCDSTRATSRSACDYQRLQAKLQLSIKARG